MVYCMVCIVGLGRQVSYGRLDIWVVKYHMLHSCMGGWELYVRLDIWVVKYHMLVVWVGENCMVG